MQAIPPKQILRDIRGLWWWLDAVPSVTDYKEHGRYSTRPVYRHFDGFVAAREAAGVHDGDLSRLDRDELIRRVQQLYDELGREPSIHDYMERWSYTEPFAEYGGFIAIKKAAGAYEGGLGPHREIGEQAVIEDLRRVEQQVDGPLSVEDYKEHGRVSRRFVTDMFGSFPEARAAAGLHPDSLLYRTGSEHPNATGYDKSMYKTYSWYRNKRKVLERDGWQCVHCGMAVDEHIDKHGRSLNVHHVIPSRFGMRDGEVADESVNAPSNLITLCEEHHRRLYEGIFARKEELTEVVS